MDSVKDLFEVNEVDIERFLYTDNEVAQDKTLVSTSFSLQEACLFRPEILVVCV